MMPLSVANVHPPTYMCNVSGMYSARLRDYDFHMICLVDAFLCKAAVSSSSLAKDDVEGKSLSRNSFQPIPLLSRIAGAILHRILLAG